jgi:hypothetical protein
VLSEVHDVDVLGELIEVLDEVLLLVLVDVDTLVVDVLMDVVDFEVLVLVLVLLDELAEVLVDTLVVDGDELLVSRQQVARISP